MSTSSDFLVVDNTRYDVGVLTDVEETADFLDKYANRNEKGTLKRKLIGVYYNYNNINFEPQDDDNYNDFEKLWKKLSEPEEFHTIKIANLTFKAYVHSLKRNIYDFRNGKAYHKDMTCCFTAQKPSRK